MKTTLATRWQHFVSDPSPQGGLRRGFALLAVVTLVTAWFSETFFFPDEHFQILEYMAMKLGITAPADLPWEFHAEARPFLQPFLYYLIAKPLLALGLHDLFDVVFVLRLVTGLVSLGALWVFVQLIFDDLPDDSQRRSFARMLPFMGYLPYLFVRTASETACAAAFTVALVMTVRASRSGRLWPMLWAGLLGGAAFEFRYQAAFLVLGLFAWAAIIARAKLKQLVLFVIGGLAAIALSLPIDRWGYGKWCFPPWAYFDVNLIQGVAAKTFGSSPVFAYLYLELGTIFAPIAAVLIVALIGTCLRHPKHYLTWVTVPFVLIHSIVAHKEERFLFPLAIFAVAYPMLAFAPAPFLRGWERVWAYRTSLAAKTVGALTVAAMLFLMLHPFGLRPHMMMAKYLYRTYGQSFHAATFLHEDISLYPMFRPREYGIDVLDNRTALASRLESGPVLLMTDGPALPVQAKGYNAMLDYSEFPLASVPLVAQLGAETQNAIDWLRRNTPLHPPRLKWLTLYAIWKPGTDGPVLILGKARD